MNYGNPRKNKFNALLRVPNSEELSTEVRDTKNTIPRVMRYFICYPPDLIGDKSNEFVEDIILLLKTQCKDRLKDDEFFMLAQTYESAKAKAILESLSLAGAEVGIYEIWLKDKHTPWCFYIESASSLRLYSGKKKAEES